MPAQLVFIPQSMQGIIIAYSKFYPFSPIQNPSAPLIDVFKLTPQKSGVYFWVLYYYTTTPTNVYYFTLWSLDKYYPPGSTNYNGLSDLSTYFGNGQMGAKLSSPILANEIDCYISSQNVFFSQTAFFGNELALEGIKSSYVCSYKYNPQYILNETNGMFYIQPGQSAWIGVSTNSLGSGNVWATARALAVWEVY